ncbi:MAG: hypothetical protein ACXACY_29375, partial [Candidatus Hodarchaeales archaeon]
SQYGVYVYSGSSKVNNSTVTGGTFGIYNRDSQFYSFMIGSSQISGGHNGTAGVDKVVNCHDENYDPIPNL